MEQTPVDKAYDQLLVAIQNLITELNIASGNTASLSNDYILICDERRDEFPYVSTLVRPGQPSWVTRGLLDEAQSNGGMRRVCLPSLTQADAELMGLASVDDEDDE